MRKVDAKDILNYENKKKEFYSKRNKKIEAIIDDEYCEFEEKVYGDSLSSIYQGLDEIRKGKEYLKVLLFQILIAVIFFAQSLACPQNKDGFVQVLSKINSVIWIALVITIIWKVVNINKYKTYVLFLLEKMKISLNKQLGNN